MMTTLTKGLKGLLLGLVTVSVPVLLAMPGTAVSRADVDWANVDWPVGAGAAIDRHDPDLALRHVPCMARLDLLDGDRPPPGVRDTKSKAARTVQCFPCFIAAAAAADRDGSHSVVRALTFQLRWPDLMRAVADGHAVRE